MNSLDGITRTLCALKDYGKNAVESSLKMLLYAMTGFEREEKNKKLQCAVPFIKNWVIANVGENFSYGRDEDIKKEYQVYRSNDNRFDITQIYSFGLICTLLMRVTWNGKKHFEIYFIIILKGYAIK